MTKYTIRVYIKKRGRAGKGCFALSPLQLAKIVNNVEFYTKTSGKTYHTETTRGDKILHLILLLLHPLSYLDLVLKKL